MPTQTSVFRIKANYEESVPRCGTCALMIEPIKSDPTTGTKSRPPRCSKGHINVTFVGVCDEWICKKTKVGLLQHAIEHPHAPLISKVSS